MDATATRRDSQLHGIVSPIDAARTLSVLAEYRLSEAGRKASLLTGGDGRTEQRLKMAVPVTRLHLVHVDGNGVARLKLRPQFKLNAEQRVVKIKLAPVYDHPPTLEDLLQDAARNHEFERTYHAQRSASQAAQRQTFDDWRNQIALDFLGDSARRAVVHPAPTRRRCQVMTDRGPVYFDARRDPGMLKQVAPEALRRFEQDVRMRHSAGAERRAQTDAVHAQKRRVMHAWIREHGSSDQKDRLQAGVLPFEEFVDAFADNVFRPLAHLERYCLDGSQRLQAHLRRLGTYPNAVVAPAELSVVTRLLSTATPEQWALTQEIHNALGIVSVQLRERSLGWTRHPDAPKLKLTTALITTVVDGISVRREFYVPVASDARERTEEDELMKA
jgi:hypothetical protein